MLHFPHDQEDNAQRDRRDARTSRGAHADQEDGEKFATKEDVAKLDVKIGKLDVSIHRELEAIKKQLQNVSGYGKEIDHALERIAAIEKHLGINKKIAA